MRDFKTHLKCKKDFESSEESTLSFLWQNSGGTHLTLLGSTYHIQVLCLKCISTHSISCLLLQIRKLNLGRLSNFPWVIWLISDGARIQSPASGFEFYCAVWYAVSVKKGNEIQLQAERYWSDISFKEIEPQSSCFYCGLFELSVEVSVCFNFSL